MSRFRHAVKDRDQHIQTLRIACAVLAFFLLFTCAGWMLAPSKLTVHNPPDLRTGSTRPWWEVPPPTVYSFAFYIFQQLNAWPKNGEVDYSAKINALSPYLTPSCQDFLKADAKKRGDAGELTDRVRVVYEVPGRGYQSQSVTVQDRDHWIARLDVVADEYFHAEPVKRAWCVTRLKWCAGKVMRSATRSGWRWTVMPVCPSVWRRHRLHLNRRSQECFSDE